MGFYPRKRLFVDQQVQGALMFRVCVYWLVCVGLIAAMLACWSFYLDPTQNLPTVFAGLWFQYAPAIVVSLLILPLVLFDVVRLSNRFVGPVYRLRQKMRALAEGQTVDPIKFRDGDFWLNLADEFNALLVLVKREAKRPLATDAPTAVHDEPTVETAGTVRNGRFS